jgi:hypothetical protein
MSKIMPDEMRVTAGNGNINGTSAAFGALAASFRTSVHG